MLALSPPQPSGLSLPRTRITITQQLAPSQGLDLGLTLGKTPSLSFIYSALK